MAVHCLKRNDIHFSVLTMDINKYGNRGRIKTWSMSGVWVFLVLKPIDFPNPLPNRFAVSLNRKGTCNWLEVGNYYCHSYQTKMSVGGEYRILQSKAMASMLQQMFKKRYHPRRNEFSNKPPKNGTQIQGNKRNESTLHNSRVFTSWQHPPP